MKLMYKTCPNTVSESELNSFSANDVCSKCGKCQSVAAIGGYGAPCIKCKLSSATIDYKIEWKEIK